MKAFCVSGCLSQAAAWAEFSWNTTLSFCSFLVAMKVTVFGLLLERSSISSSARLALVTRSFSVRSDGGELGEFLSASTNNCLSAMLLLATTSTCSGLMDAWVTDA